MNIRNIIRLSWVFPVVLILVIFNSKQAFAHCDTVDGPVVKAAQLALKTRNVNAVLIWVSKKDESEIRERFRQTLAVRGLNREARRLADNYFFETVVRLHRVGEGEPYLGIKPAGIDLAPIIPAADKAIQEGSVAALLKLFPVAESPGIETRFRDVIARKRFKVNDVDSGREYVKAYIAFLHYVEHLYEERRDASE